MTFRNSWGSRLEKTLVINVVVNKYEALFFFFYNKYEALLNRLLLYVYTFKGKIYIYRKFKILESFNDKLKQYTQGNSSNQTETLPWIC